MQHLEAKKESYWVLKCDIKKFFYNIDPNILFKIMEKHVRDEDLLEFTKLLIFDRRSKYELIGIPIRKLYFTVFCKYLFK